jgi:4,5-dihydroxyphthalate decarboxylase
MSTVSMTFASWPYDRTAALRDGTVTPKGIDFQYLPSHPGDTFLRMLGDREFEASEMSMSSLLMSKELDDPFVAIPIFTSRTFRHNNLYVNDESGITDGCELAGKKIGIPEYQITSALWIRGILQHEYGVPPEQVTWYAERWGDGRHSHGSAVGFEPPDDVSIVPIPDEESQVTLLQKGEIDAAFLIQEVPSSFCRSSMSDLKGNGGIRRLFVNYKETEMDYYRRTGLFPIMHTVVVRRDVYEKAPWVAESLYEAFSAAKAEFYKNMGEWELFSFPWIREALEEQQELLGDDPYPYGIANNKAVIEAICQYSNEQGLTSTHWRPEELFATELAGT